MSTEKQILSDLSYSTHFTDLGNLDYFLALFGDLVRYDSTRGRWYFWQEHFWEEDDVEHLQDLIMRSIRHRYKAASEIHDEKFREATRGWAIKSESEGRTSALRRLLQRSGRVVLPARKWDVDPNLFAVANGVLHLDTGSFVDGTPEQLIHQHSRVVYDPAARAPRFEKFLDEIFEGDSDLIYYMQRALGYSLTGLNTEQLLFFCHGAGSNGKSVLFAVLADILGSYGVSIPSATFTRNVMNTQTNDLAMMQGKRFVMAAESLSATKMDEQKLKKISGGDELTVRFLHHEFFSFRPIAKVWLFLNHMPMFDDDSYSFWRRVRLIPFQRTFKGEDIDYQLIPKLQSELPGILNWLVDGARLWYEEGLKVTPESVTLATEDVRQGNNRLVDFLAEWCEEKDDYSEKASTLYTAYIRWAEFRNFQRRDIMSQNAFGRLITDKYKKIRTQEGNYYQGITLKVEHKVL